MLILPQITFGSQSPRLVTSLWTGNTTARSITTNQRLVDGALVWIKSRTSTSSHYLFDTVQGVEKYINSNGSNAQITNAGTLTSYNANGFSLGTTSDTNNTGLDYVGWSFLKKAGFMDIVSYSTNGGIVTVSHNLATTVGLIINAQSYNTGAISWPVYHKNVSGGDALNLNNTDGVNVGSATFSSVTTSSFGVKTTGIPSGRDCVAYVFAHNPAKKIFCGTFTTDGSGNATITGLGFTPKWLLVKRADGADSWIIIDVAREWTGSAEKRLFPDLSSAEATSTTYFPLTADGFNVSAFNASATHIYMAIG